MDGDRDEATLAEQGEVARGFVAGLVETLGVPAQVSVREADEETVEVAVEGEGLGRLIGPKASVLHAIQELAKTTVQRRVGGNARLVVEVGGYWAQRRVALERFTRQVADEVQASGQPRALEPMGASDRKVVHDTVNALDGLRTTSEGEQPYRYVVIAPSDDSDTGAGEDE
jgi:spoIIIJ-associated protein